MTVPESPEDQFAFLLVANAELRSRQYRQLTEDLAALVVELEAMSDSAFAELSKSQPFGRTALPRSSLDLIEELGRAQAAAVDLLADVNSIERTGRAEAQNDPCAVIPTAPPSFER
ncbi:MAG: hypothetical protein EON54_01755 [Alcaligenaceae bacterium]|nr:MAG: hypothetical protein EON54_01755 [Alcaligenaceae bacterium]